MQFRVLALFAMLPFAAPASAQPSTPVASGPALNVFLDCFSCDFDYLRTEIASVNWVRDREVADVHLLVTTQTTGAGGSEYTIAFLGLRRFAGMADTLRYVVPPASSDDDRRRGLARMFRMGLVRYLLRTPVADRITVEIPNPPADSTRQSQVNDPWRAWVFRVSMSSFMDGEKTYNSASLHGRVSADRVTEAWKTRVAASENYSESEFEIDDTTTVVNLQRGYNGELLQVKSLGQHWSAGFRADFQSSTYENFKQVIRAAPAIEWNLFPYSESTRRQLRLEYNFGYASYRYRDTTVFDRLRESMPIQRLEVSGAVREPWGSGNIGIEGISYLDGRDMYRIGTFAELSLRLFKGFNFDIWGNYDIIQDQFALAKKDFTPEQILTRQFQRATTYRYFGSVGFSYTFGSIYNNVVNPRMN